MTCNGWQLRPRNATARYNGAGRNFAWNPISTEVFMDDSDWQQDFISKNLLILGYNAWLGYRHSGRGVLVTSTNAPTVSMAGESFATYFVQRPHLAAFLNAWLAAPDTAILRHHFIKKRGSKTPPFTVAFAILKSEARVINLSKNPIA
jgi:hypothetical protein